VRAELGRSGLVCDDLDEALERYDLAASAHTALKEAEATRRRSALEVSRLLGDEGLEEARRRLAALEEGLNGHGELAEGRDLEDVEADLRQAAALHDEAAARAARLDATLAERARTAADTAGLREQLDAAAERVARIERVDAVLRLAEDELTAAAEETYRDLAPRLGTALAGPIGRLTGGRYTTAFVEDDLSVRLEAPELAEVVDLEAVSHGTQRQAYLVQRLELARLLCPGDAAPPLLLDDPFAHFDAERMERTLAYVAELAAERQIIVFSTEPRAVELAPPGALIVQL